MGSGRLKRIVTVAEFVLFASVSTWNMSFFSRCSWVFDHNSFKLSDCVCLSSKWLPVCNQWRAF